jgi:signal transduction histidine kinase
MKKILVIDDEIWLREMINLALEQKGYKIVEAENGEVGIAKAQEFLPDLILCDVNMGKVDGYLTLSSLRAIPATASIPFILMTGMSDTAAMRHGMELGADDYLIKPFSIDELYKAVETRLKKSQVEKAKAEEKMSTLRDNIIMMLPHELKTPLNGILGLGELLTSTADSLSPAEIADFGRDICESGRRLERLIENFLVYSQIELLATDPHRAEALRRKQTPAPRSVVETRLQQQAKNVGRLPDLKLDLADRPVAISEEYLSKIVDEVAHNALKFSAPGSSINVKLFPTADRLTLSIQDHGRGFKKEDFLNIGAYMQFDRKTNEQQGQGLGLIIAKRLTELHSGSIELEDPPANGGTTLTIRLPLAALN